MKFFLCCAVAVLMISAPVGGAVSESSAERQIFEQLNQERRKSGLAVLEWNDAVAIAARHHSQALAENGKLSHQFAGEAAVAERIASTGVRFTLAAENVARTDYVEDAHLALMNSPGHRANILNPRYNAVGIGVVEQQGKVYVTQDFIFLVPKYSEAQFNAALVESLNLARSARGARKFDVKPDAFLRDLACTTDGDAQKLSGSVSGDYAMVFSSSEPRQLPEQVLEQAGNPNFHHVKFGVCFRPDEKHGHANFWVVASFES